MKKELHLLLCFFAIVSTGVTCKKQTPTVGVPGQQDTALVNTSHLDYLYTPVTFTDGTNAAGIYIYAEAPNYTLTAAAGEGYTCVDDVSRAALVYLRSDKFPTDTAIQNKVYKLINFLLEMQSPNGYFYNFLLTGNQINKYGTTSINNPEWWSWRALQALSEGAPIVKVKNQPLSIKMDKAINQLVAVIKNDLVNLPQTTKVVNGITVPQWLPAGSGTDQAALLIIGLIPYSIKNNDATIAAYIRKLSDGILMMQQGDATHFPYGAFLSWENTWHAYGNDQAFALLKAAAFLNDSKYSAAAYAEIDNFYPWLLTNGYKSSFIISKNGNAIQLTSENNYEQIAYGIRPMVFAAAEAYKLTGQAKFADLAGHIAAWFLGANIVGKNMYSLSTGRCYDAIASATSINTNSGAESTIEALFTMQTVENNAAIKTAFNIYKK